MEEHSPHAEHVDVLIVGAGLSGIGAARHLQERCPGKSFRLLEARDSLGGTWDLFKYPGIRSDSDMYTLGYSFKPWEDAKSIADGPSILAYVRRAAEETGVRDRIHFGHRVRSAQWSSTDARWTVQAERVADGQSVTFTAGFYLNCSGYYRYDEGFTPQFDGIERFRGELVHPQHWPEALDYTGKRVVVIGSGATAVTLVPAMAERAGHVTMLQRSPTYVVTLPAEDPVAKLLKRVLPLKLAYSIVRWKNVAMTTLSFQVSRRRPELVKAIVRRQVKRMLPAGYDVDTHFKPTYNPWDQRLCLVPNGDLFEAIGSGRASVVTDHIDTFTERGVRLRSGAELEADVIVTATGLNLLALGGVELTVDGQAVSVPDAITYKGMMLSGVPNLAVAFGYTNASWTLKCDLTCEYVCRLLNLMDERGYASCTAPAQDPSVATDPFIDFSSGYVQRAIAHFPRQGKHAPWRLHQNYALDIFEIRRGELEDGTLRFTPARGSTHAGAAAALAA